MLGFGLGLRTDHYLDILDNQPKTIDWFEIITENYLVPGGKPLCFLDQIAQLYPLVMHGVSLSIGSSDPLNWDYLKQVKQLAKRVNARWISDHLCWTGVNAHNLHDLMPMPYTEASLKHVIERVLKVQEFLAQPILLENPSSYLEFKANEMGEAEFLAQLVKHTDCLLLLDINNIYVSSFNHGFDPIDYLHSIPKSAVRQIHLAGHTQYENYIIDTHDHPIVDSVWQLYKTAIEYLGPVATMIERDDHIPELSELIAELNQARIIYEQVQHEA